jgi:hypothetical protein
MKRDKNNLVIIASSVLIIIITFLFTVNSQNPITKSITKDNCLADDCLLVDNLDYPAGTLPSEVQMAIDKAINDEYVAYSTYDAVIKKLGSVRPFSMIINAEEQHISRLKSIYTKYGIKIPSNKFLGTIKSPTTIKDACQTGVMAEIANVNLYKDELIPVVKNYEDITLVFTDLMTASLQKHLPAFEKCN